MQRVHFIYWLTLQELVLITCEYQVYSFKLVANNLWHLDKCHRRLHHPDILSFHPSTGLPILLEWSTAAHVVQHNIYPFRFYDPIIPLAVALFCQPVRIDGNKTAAVAC